MERLDDDRFGVRLFVKRDDLIHPDFPGNKWRKLKYNLPAEGRTVLTFGGAYSNHIRAVAAAGHHFGFATIGIIRGEECRPLNPVLAAATPASVAPVPHAHVKTSYGRSISPMISAAPRTACSFAPPSGIR